MLHTGTMLRIKAENPHESDCFVMNAMNVKAILWTTCCCQKENACTHPRTPAPVRECGEARGSTQKHEEAQMHCIVVQKSVAVFEGR
jgi:hypothetical protein